MPEIFNIDGIRIEMLYDEHNPPHFHAEYSGERASFKIDNGNKIAGELPQKKLRTIRKFAKKYKPELEDNWQRAREGKKLCKIQPKKQVS